MISPDEREQLDIMMGQEADFYAPLLFLVLMRLPHQPMSAAPWPRSLSLESPSALRDTIVGAYADLNAMMNAEDAVT
jgi:hypothetical protein